MITIIVAQVIPTWPVFYCWCHQPHPDSEKQENGTQLVGVQEKSFCLGTRTALFKRESKKKGVTVLCEYQGLRNSASEHDLGHSYSASGILKSHA